MTRDSRLNPFIACTLCGLHTKVLNENALEAATEQEYNQVLIGLCYCKIDHSQSAKDSKKVKFVKLQNCLNKLNKHLKLGQKADTKPEPPNSDKLLNAMRYDISLIVRQHWEDIEKKLGHSFDRTDPLDRIEDLPYQQVSSSGCTVEAQSGGSLGLDRQVPLFRWPEPSLMSEGEKSLPITLVCISAIHR